MVTKPTAKGSAKAKLGGAKGKAGGAKGKLGAGKAKEAALEATRLFSELSGGQPEKNVILIVRKKG